MKRWKKGLGRRLLSLALTALLLLTNNPGLTQLGLGTIVARADGEPAALTVSIKAGDAEEASESASIKYNETLTLTASFTQEIEAESGSTVSWVWAVENSNSAITISEQSGDVAGSDNLHSSTAKITGAAVTQDAVKVTATAEITKTSTNEETGETESTKTHSGSKDISITVGKADGPEKPNISESNIKYSINNNAVVYTLTGLTASTSYDYAYGENVTDFTSVAEADKGTATTDSEGKLTVKKNGTVFVRLSATETHEAGSATSVNIPEAFIVTFDANGQNGATGIPDPVAIATGKKITKAETDPTAEGKDFKGWFKEAAGTTEWNFENDTVTEATTLYAKWENEPVAVTGVTLDKSTASVAVDKTIKLTATVSPDNATDKTVTWTSSSGEVATVENGTVTGVAKGTATITATAGGKSATCTVTVKPAVTVITVTPIANKIVVNGTTTVTASVEPSNAISDVEWSSGDTSVATVAVNEETNAVTVTGVATGTATITATAKDGSGVTGSANITIGTASQAPTLAENSQIVLTMASGDPKTAYVGEAGEDGVIPLYSDETKQTGFVLKTGEEVTKVTATLNVPVTVVNSDDKNLYVKAGEKAETTYGVITAIENNKIEIVPESIAGDNGRSKGMAAEAAKVVFTVKANALTDATTGLGEDAKKNEAFSFSLNVEEAQEPKVTAAAVTVAGNNTAVNAVKNDDGSFKVESGLTQGSELSKLELTTDIAVALAKTNPQKVTLAYKNKSNENVTVTEAYPIISLDGAGTTATISFKKTNSADGEATTLKLSNVGTVTITLPAKTLFNKSTAIGRLEEEKWIGNKSAVTITLTVSAPEKPAVTGGKYIDENTSLTKSDENKFIASITEGDDLQSISLTLDPAAVINVNAFKAEGATENPTVYNLKGKQTDLAEETDNGETVYGSLTLASNGKSATITLTSDGKGKIANEGVYDITIPAKAFANAVLGENGVVSDGVSVDDASLSAEVTIEINVAPAEKPVVKSAEIKDSKGNTIETTVNSTGTSVSATMTQGEAVSKTGIKFTMSKNVKIVAKTDETAGNYDATNEAPIVWMSMVAGDYANNFDKVPYGTISAVSGKDVTVTPYEGNEVAGWPGTMKLYIPAGILQVDGGAGKNAGLTFLLTVTSVGAPAVDSAEGTIKLTRTGAAAVNAEAGENNKYTIVVNEGDVPSTITVLFDKEIALTSGAKATSKVGSGEAAEITGDGVLSVSEKTLTIKVDSLNKLGTDDVVITIPANGIKTKNTEAGAVLDSAIEITLDVTAAPVANVESVKVNYTTADGETGSASGEAVTSEQGASTVTVSGLKQGYTVTSVEMTFDQNIKAGENSEKKITLSYDETTNADQTATISSTKATISGLDIKLTKTSALTITVAEGVFKVDDKVAKDNKGFTITATPAAATKPAASTIALTNKTGDTAGEDISVASKATASESALIASVDAGPTITGIKLTSDAAAEIMAADNKLNISYTYTAVGASSAEEAKTIASTIALDDDSPNKGFTISFNGEAENKIAAAGKYVITIPASIIKAKDTDSVGNEAITLTLELKQTALDGSVEIKKNSTAIDNTDNKAYYGDELTAAATISNAAGELKYAWNYADGSNAAALGTNETYEIKLADVGKAITVSVTTESNSGSVEATTAVDANPIKLTVQLKDGTSITKEYDGTKDAKISVADLELVADGILADDQAKEANAEAGTEAQEAKVKLGSTPTTITGSYASETAADAINVTFSPALLSLDGDSAKGYTLGEDALTLSGKITVAAQPLTLTTETVTVKVGETFDLAQVVGGAKTKLIFTPVESESTVGSVAATTAEGKAIFTGSAAGEINYTVTSEAEADKYAAGAVAESKKLKVVVTENESHTVTLSLKKGDAEAETVDLGTTKEISYAANDTYTLTPAKTPASTVADGSGDFTVTSSDGEIVAVTAPAAGQTDYTLTVKKVGEAIISVTAAEGTVSETVEETTTTKTYNATTVSFTLKVEPAKVTKPVAAAGTFTYANGTTHTGVTVVEEAKANINESSGEFETATGTNAGTYTYTASLKDPSTTTWSDNTTADVVITWEIKKAAGKAAPSGLSGHMPSSATATDFAILGTTTEMEYSTNKTAVTPCTVTANVEGDKGGTIVPGAGTYYVRYKGSDNQEASDWTEVTVDAYTEVTLTYNYSGKGEDKVETYAKGTSVTKPADPTATGYTFGGWYSETITEGISDEKLVWGDSKTGNITLTENTTLYAKWTAAELNNVPVIKKGTETISDDTVHYGDTLTADVSNITNFSSDTIIYEWFVENNAVADSNAATYTVKPGDVSESGKSIKVQVKTADQAAKESAAVTAKPVELTVTGSVAEGVYGTATTSVTVKYELDSNEFVSSDSITLSPTTASGTYENANAGDSKAVTVTTPSFTLSGTNYEGYVIKSDTPAAVTGKIATLEKPISVKGALTVSKDGTLSKEELDAAIVDAGVRELSYAIASESKGSIESDGTYKPAADAQIDDVVFLTVTAAAHNPDNQSPDEIASATTTLTITINGLGTQTVSFGDTTLDGTVTTEYDDSQSSGNLKISYAAKSTVDGKLAKLATITKSPAAGVDGAITYSSSNEAVVTVDTSTGKITLVGAGTATITATAAATTAHNAGSASYVIVVTAAAAAAPTLSPSSTTFTGAEITVTATPATSDAYTYDASSVWSAYVPGTYYVKPILNNGYEWDSQSSSVPENGISWTITTSGTAIAPEGLDNGGGKITGLNSNLEYAYRAKANDGAAENAWTPVDANSTEITSLVAGDYEVKFADKYFENDKNTTFATVTVSAQSSSGGGASTTPIALTGITVTPTTAKVEVGKSVTLTSAFVPADTTETPTVTWSSSDTSIATVANGVVTGVKAGSVTITAKVTNEAGTELSATATIEVVEELKPVTAISISPVSAVVEEKGSTTLSVVFTPDDQNENPEVSWSSADSTIATVSGGTVTGVKAGSTTITATVTGENGTLTATASITVTEKIVPLEGISLNTTSLTIEKGKSDTIIVSFIPEDATNKNVVWSSGNTAIATVSGGVVSGVSAGITSVTASVGEDIVAAAIVTVTEPAGTGETGEEEIFIEDEPDPDLTHLIEDTDMGKELGEVIKEVITTDATTGETVTNIWIGGIQPSYTYTGSAIKPGFHVYDGVRELTEKTDYTVSYKNNKNAGETAQISVKFKGNYQSTPAQTINFKIAAADLGSKDFEAENLTVYATGKALKAVPVVSWNGKNLAKSNYKVSITDSKGAAVSSLVEAGEYTATIEKNNTNFTGSTTATISVIAKNEKARDLSKAKVSLPVSKATWTGKEITLDESKIVVTDAAGKKVDSAKYSVSYTGNINPGKATVIITATDTDEDGYVGSKATTFTIAKGKGGENVSVFVNDAVYSKAGAKPAVKVIDNDTGKVLSQGTDYTVKYSNNTKATGEQKSAVVTVNGKGNYKFTETAKFAISTRPISSLYITVADQTNAKNWSKAKVTVSDGGKKLGSKDYSVKVTDTAPAADGIVHITISGDGTNYGGTVEKTYRVISAAQNLAKAKQAKKISNQTYTGSAITLSDSELSGLLYFGAKGSAALTLGTDYKVSAYEKNIKKGIAKVTLVGTGNYGGSKTLSFKITQKTGNWKSTGKTLVGGEWTNK